MSSSYVHASIGLPAIQRLIARFQNRYWIIAKTSGGRTTHEISNWLIYLRIRMKATAYKLQSMNEDNARVHRLFAIDLNVLYASTRAILQNWHLVKRLFFLLSNHNVCACEHKRQSILERNFQTPKCVAISEASEQKDAAEEVYAGRGIKAPSTTTICKRQNKIRYCVRKSRLFFALSFAWICASVQWKHV